MNPSPCSFRTRRPPWRLSFDSQSARLEAVHEPTGAELSGTLSFTAPAADAPTSWRVAAPCDPDAPRLSLLDGRGEVQGYLQLVVAGGRLELCCLHRAAQNYPGTLTFTGRARLGDTAFACRTQPPRQGRVVQMSSGPADSALNDSLFDPAADIALRFAAAQVSVLTQPPRRGGPPSFRVILSAHIDAPAAASLVFDLRERYYQQRWAPWYRPLPKDRRPSAPTGWMSWNVYFDQAGEQENLAEARVAAEKLKPFGLRIWSIESWQENSDTLPVSNFHNLNLRAHPRQFPHGMKWLAEQIRKLGFKPGIWTAPFGTGNAEFYAAHKSWFLHDADGAPFSNWCGRYLLDPSQPEVRDHLREMHRVMAQEWGYEFFKIDGMSGRSSSYSAHFFERPDVRAAFRDPCDHPFELCVRAFREGIGEDALFLACQGHYTGPEVQYCDAARIGADIVSPNQPSRWRNVVAQARWTLNQLFVNNLLWYNDPDTLLVGEYHPLDTARLAATVVALPGQMMFAGDKLRQLPPDRMRLLQQALPVCDVRPLDLFPVYELAPVWDLKLRRPFLDWDVVALFNWTEQEQPLGFAFTELGLPDDETTAYLLYDFWNRRFLGAHHGGYETVLQPHTSRLLAVHRDRGVPQFLSTDRHLTQGGVSLKRLRWDAKTRTLTGAVRLVKNHPTRLTLHLPPPFVYADAEATHDALVAAAFHPDRTLTLDLLADRSRTVTWNVKTTVGE